MSANIPGWGPEIERSFKEVLFRFLEEVASTKAALYLLAPDGSYRLATHYGFRRRDLLASEHLAQDPLVRKARELRNVTTMFNHPREFPEISDYLEGAGTARMLLVPLYGASRVLGFVDARDKGRKRLFDADDLTAADTIGRALLELIGQANMYNGYATSLTTEPVSPTTLPRETATDAGDSVVVDRRCLGELYDAAMGIAMRQQVVAVALTVSDEVSAATLILAGERSGDVDLGALTRHQAETLRHAGNQVPDTGAWQTEMRRVVGTGESSRSRLVASGVLLSGASASVTASVIGVLGSQSAADSLERLQRAAAAVRRESVLRHTRRNLARRLLQPGERHYADLKAHSLAVSRLCWRMAQRLGFGDGQAEEAALAGLLHDVGMRELSYELIYNHPSPGADERAQYKRHAEVGETILRGTGLDRIAAAIRHHHERWDGRGYPDRLPGVAIPFLARLVHVAEVYDVLTGSHSYRRPVGPQRALSIIKSAAGHQFDPEMVELLAKVAE